MFFALYRLRYGNENIKLECKVIFLQQNRSYSNEFYVILSAITGIF